MAAKQKFWVNVAVAMASAAGIGAAIPITAITQTSPCVVTYSGAVDPNNGNWVLLSVQGMVEVDRCLFRVANVNAAGNTCELEGVDATGYKAFVGGSFQIINFDKSFSTLSEPTGSGGDPVFEDTTLIHSAKDTRAIVSSTPEDMAFTSVWDPSDPALIEAKRAFVTKTPRPVLVTFADSSKYAFTATVAAPLAPQTGGRKVTTKIAFAVENTGTAYAT